MASSGLPNLQVNSFTASEGTIFVGIFGSGVYASADNGASWTAVNSGFNSDIGRPALRLSNHTPFKIVSPGAGGSKASIVFFLIRRERVTVAVYNLSGHIIQSLADMQFGPGPQALFWDTRSLVPGCYTVRMKAGKKICVKNFMLMR